jgi:hypothetical protein
MQVFSFLPSIVVNFDNLLLGGAEDNQSIAKSVQGFHGVSELGDLATEQNLVLFFSGDIAVLVPHSLNCVDLSKSQLVTPAAFQVMSLTLEPLSQTKSFSTLAF